MTNYIDMHGWTISARRFSAPVREGFHFFGAWQGTDYVGPCNTAEDAWQGILEVMAEANFGLPEADCVDYERAAVIALARRLDAAALDAEACAAGPGRYEGADDLALVVALDILSGHGCADDRAGETDTGLYLERFGRYVLATNSQGFVTAYRCDSDEEAQSHLDAEAARTAEEDELSA